jgi:hypothetical protein
LEPLDGIHVTFTSGEPREEDSITDRERDLLNIDRTFCHDALIAAIRKVQPNSNRFVILAEYIFMSRVLPLFGGEAFKVIDTIDVFSTKQKKVVQYGISDSLAMSADEERVRLQRADLIIAIQSSEREELASIVPDREVITVGVDFEVRRHNSVAPGNCIVYVASDNAMNIKGLRDFLRFAWPWTKREVPDAVLKVAGRVCSAVQDPPIGVELLGPVEDLASLYRGAKVAINPAIAGTGLKIKTVEALCYFRPVVSWPCGVDGMDRELAILCCSVTDWWQFARLVVEILRDPRPDWFSPAQQETIRRHLSPEHVYAPLEERLRAFFSEFR